MSFRRRKLSRAFGTTALLLGAVLTGGCAAEYPLTIFEPVTELGDMVNELFGLVFWLTLGILVVVFGVLAYVLVRYRDRPDAPEPKKIYGNTLAEVLWTLGPAVIVAIILVPTVQGIFRSYEPAPDDALIVEVVGHQWWWEYRYPQYDLVTANQVHLPVDRPIEARLATADVLHAWWFPHFGGKRDNFPRTQAVTDREAQATNWHRLNFTIRESGEYPGQCAEYCGLAHAIMKTQAVVEPQGAFEDWVAEMKVSGTPAGVEAPQAAAAAAQPTGAAAQEAPGAPEPAADSLVQRGYEVFTTSACVACHAVEGTPAQGQIGPNLTNFGDRWSVGAGMLPNNRENVIRWIKNPSEIKPGAKMPGTEEGGGGMPPTGLSDDEVRAVAAYLLSL